MPEPTQRERILGVRSCRSSGVGVVHRIGLYCARVSNKQLGDLFQKGLHICRGSVSQILNQNQTVSTLLEGALREIEKPCFVTRPALLKSFCDVGRNGNRRAPHLARKAIDLTSGKDCRKRIGRQYETMGLLPYNQVLECLCCFCHAVEIELSS